MRRKKIKFLEQWETADGNYVTIKADGRTDAYFWDNAGIRGVVWLFNLVPAPAIGDWISEDVESGPLNPASHAHEFKHLDDLCVDDFSVVLKTDADPKSAGIYFRDQLIGIVYDGKSPGKSRFAKADSPIALKMGVHADRTLD